MSDVVTVLNLFKHYDPGVPRHVETLKTLESLLPYDVLLELRSRSQAHLRNEPIDLNTFALEYKDSFGGDIVEQITVNLSDKQLQRLTEIWRGVSAEKKAKPKPRGKLIQIPNMGEVGLLEPIIKNGNFTWKEATHGGQRIPRNRQHAQNIIYLAKKLELVRESFDNRPIIVTSWYRPEPYNKRVGGATYSKHKSGHAVDFVISGLGHQEVYKSLLKWWREGGIGSGYLCGFAAHLDCRCAIDKQPWAKWGYRGGAF